MVACFDVWLHGATRINKLRIGYTMRMRVSDCITGLYQNAEAFPFAIGSSRAVQCN